MRRVGAITDHRHRITHELPGALGFVLVIWAVFALSLVVPLHRYGLEPRTLSGLWGIFTMPFLHTGLRHISGNTLPLMVLLVLLAGSRTRSSLAVAMIVVFNGALLWVFGRSALHVGASGLVFGLATFLLVSGILERRIVSLLVSLVVGLTYGSTLVAGILPSTPGVSWDGHLCGAAAGILTAYRLRTRQDR